MPTLHVLRVFCAEDGSGGNELGVFLAGTEVPEDHRQAVAAELGYAETVFVDDRQRGEIRIFTPTMEQPLAGHPLVGTAWLLREQGSPPSTLRPPAGEVPVTYERELVFCAGRPEWGPEFDFVQLDSPDGVEGLSEPPSQGNVGVWAWIDEEAGWIRERVFVPEVGVAEDEATGSAALRLCAQLGHPIEIRQGRNSLIFARPAEEEGFIEIGGRVALEEIREHS